MATASHHLTRGRDFCQFLIDTKKTKRREDQMRSALFTAIGLCLSLLVVLIAFQWKFYDQVDLVNLGNLSPDFEEMLEIPITEQPPPPPPPQMQVAVITAVPDAVEIEEEIQINLDVEITEESVIEEVIYESLEIEEEKAEEIFQFVEQQPHPIGGMQAFYKFVGENLKYPNKARNAGIEGKVYVQFVVNKDGKLTDIVVLKGIGFGCDEEAMRAVAASPAWEPGKQRGKPVRVRMSVPIVFMLLDS